MQTESIIDGVRDLLPTIRARRQEIEQSRRMPRDLVDALRATRMFAMGAPRAIGGHELPPGELMRAIESVATADGSAGRCAMIALATASRPATLSDKGAKDSVRRSDGTDRRYRGARRGRDPCRRGIRITGRWPFASGITHCDWLWAGCLVMDNGRPRMTPFGPEIVHACIPVRDVEIHRYVVRERVVGSGSNDFSVADVFVPEHRLFSLLDPDESSPGAAVSDAAARTIYVSGRIRQPRHRAQRPRRTDGDGANQSAIAVHHTARR